MGFFDVSKKLKQILPFQTSAEVLDEIALQSSYVPFKGPGEILFRAGDPVRGFYWILEGEAEILIPNKKPIVLRIGAMAGIDVFLDGDPLNFDIVNRSKSMECIFIDRRCYNKMRLHVDINRHMNRKALEYLRFYRNLLIPS